MKYAEREEMRKSFWRYIDSHPDYGSHYARERGWGHDRAGCIALRSDGHRCLEIAGDGAGLCDLHFNKFLKWVTWNLADEVVARAHEFAPDLFGPYIDAALVRDAKATVEAANAQVYFIAVGDIVKIGYSKNVAARFATLTAGGKAGVVTPEGYNHREAELLGCIPGGQYVERQIHWLLTEHRVRGEWFRLSEPVIAAIDYFLYGEPIPEALSRKMIAGPSFDEAEDVVA